MNEQIYIHEITTLSTDEDGVCLSNEYNMVTINPHTLVDWLPTIVELAFKEKAKQDNLRIEELKTLITKI